MVQCETEQWVAGYKPRECNDRGVPVRKYGHERDDSGRWTRIRGEGPDSFGLTANSIGHNMVKSLGFAAC
jgi:hypothetical protein